MPTPMIDLRRRLLTTFALNRTPGFTFAGNWLGVRFGETTPRCASIAMDAGAHTEDEHGRIDNGAVCLLADIAMATAVRANLTPEQRLATVGMHLQFTGVPPAGALGAVGEFERFVDGAGSRQGLCRVALQAGGSTVLFGTGAFMVMNPPPGQTMYPLVSAVHEAATPLAIEELDAGERRILACAEAAMSAAPSPRGFSRRFWGFLPESTPDGAICRTDNGPHLGNRVGHFQGGLQMGMAIDTAAAALPADWAVSGVSAFFLSPGDSAQFVAEARIEHRGRSTAVVRTVLTGKEARRLLVMETVHLRRG